MGRGRVMDAADTGKGTKKDGERLKDRGRESNPEREIQREGQAEHLPQMATASPLIDSSEQGPPGPSSGSNLPDAPRASMPHVPRASAWRGRGG